jgi:hypothetical protein
MYNKNLPEIADKLYTSRGIAVKIHEAYSHPPVGYKLPQGLQIISRKKSFFE